jgi:sporulation protein YlmC with PRC-barrel domain
MLPVSIEINDVSFEEVRMRVKELIGKEVLDAKAKRVGKVSDLEVNVTTWAVEHLDVKSGFAKGHIIGLDKIQIVGDKIILKANEEEL